MRQFEHFDKLNPTKKALIINAGLEVFSKYGYKQAPTEQITTLANISKGALFHYFGNKETFFIYLFKYASKELASRVNAVPPEKQMDILDYLPYITMQKITVFKEYPYLMNFIMKAYKEEFQMLSQIEEFNFFIQYQKHTAFIMETIDFSKLRNEISKTDFMTWVTMISLGFIELYLNNPTPNSMDQLNQSLFGLFEMMKKRFRKDDEK